MQTLKYIDTHCHIHFDDYDHDRQEMSDRMSDRAVGAIVIGTDIKTSTEVVKLAKRHENLWASIGVHPNSDDDSTALNPARIGINGSEKVVAIGECGLDYFRLQEGDTSAKEEQKKQFKTQIELAIELQVPLMLHIRSTDNTTDAHDDVLEMLHAYKQEYGEKLKIHCHFTTFGIDMAKRFIELDPNVTFGIPGVVTYKSAHDLQDLVKWLPLRKILSETDAPYAAPVPHRGERNEPVFVIDVVNAIADLRGEDREVVREQLLENAKSVFSIDITS